MKKEVKDECPVKRFVGLKPGVDKEEVSSFLQGETSYEPERSVER